MAQYIDKDALLAEIEKKLTDILTCKKDASTPEERIALTNMLRLCKEILFFINTLEVKEVDLHLAYHDFLESPRKTGYMLYEVAEYFFELGLKAQKDVWHTMDETPNYPCNILFLTDVDNIFLYRYMENGRPVDRETPYFRNILNGKCWCYCSDIVNE